MDIPNYNRIGTYIHVIPNGYRTQYLGAQTNVNAVANDRFSSLIHIFLPNNYFLKNQTVFTDPDCINNRTKTMLDQESWTDGWSQNL